MATNGLRYRYTDDGITVSKPYKFSLDFPKAKYARRSGDYIIVYNSFNHPIKVDSHGIKHW
ncbi:MAG: hypothetical protein IJL05_04920 [Alphaproteobacteria bacterium]|nr:hypothetical protein [Alphaproteobacteria bacterium]